MTNVKRCPVKTLACLLSILLAFPSVSVTMETDFTNIPGCNINEERERPEAPSFRNDSPALGGFSDSARDPILPPVNPEVPIYPQNIRLPHQWGSSGSDPLPTQTDPSEDFGNKGVPPRSGLWTYIFGANEEMDTPEKITFGLIITAFAVGLCALIKVKLTQPE